MTNVQGGYIIGFDYGLKNIGLAVGQTITCTASEQPALPATDGIPHWQTIEALLNEWRCTEVVVGLPLNMDDTESELSRRARKFGNRLHGRFGIKVHMYDERLSTREAKEEAYDRGHRGNFGDEPIDSIAARIILENWLTSQS